MWYGLPTEAAIEPAETANLHGINCKCQAGNIIFLIILQKKKFFAALQQLWIRLPHIQSSLNSYKEVGK